MKKMKFLFAVLAIVFAAGSAFTPAKKKAVDPVKKWFKLQNLAYPEDASSYVLTSVSSPYDGADRECPTEVSENICAIFATSVTDGMSIERPDATELATIVYNSNHFQEELEDGTLQYEQPE
jgi:hypothetical protein